MTEVKQFHLSEMVTVGMSWNCPSHVSSHHHVCAGINLIFELAELISATVNGPRRAASLPIAQFLVGRCMIPIITHRLIDTWTRQKVRRNSEKTHQPEKSQPRLPSDTPHYQNRTTEKQVEFPLGHYCYGKHRGNAKHTHRRGFLLKGHQLWDTVITFATFSHVSTTQFSILQKYNYKWMNQFLGIQTQHQTHLYKVPVEITAIYNVVFNSKK